MRGTFTALGPNGYGNYSIDGDNWTPTELGSDGYLTPGFVDLHIHGAFGVDFMSASEAEVRGLCDKLAEVGYEYWLPTTVTASAQGIQRTLAYLPDHPMIPGFHLEGPFLSPKYPGAQPPSVIIDAPDGPSEWDVILNDPRLRVITLAPERPGNLQLIERLSARGVICSFGHTDASFAEAQRGFEHGARHATHTFNAMRPLHHREAGTVGFILSEPEMSAELIYDRHHVVREAAGILVGLKLPDHLIAVSDSTMASGLPSGTALNMWGLDCLVGDNQIRLASNGALAGSAITLKDAFQNLAEDFGPEAAIRACCHNPRRALGLHGKPGVHLIWSSDFQLVDRLDS